MIWVTAAYHTCDHKETTATWQCALWVLLYTDYLQQETERFVLGMMYLFKGLFWMPKIIPATGKEVFFLLALKESISKCSFSSRSHGEILDLQARQSMVTQKTTIWKWNTEDGMWCLWPCSKQALGWKEGRANWVQLGRRQISVSWVQGSTS